MNIVKLALTFFIVGIGLCRAEIALVGVASSFRPVLEEIIKNFESKSKHQIKLASGSSGKLYAQIKSGAPFDLFLSADAHKPKALVKDGLALDDNKFLYAVGRLALWSSAKITTDKLVNKLKSYDGKLAIANPRLAPYGQAAVETLESMKLYQGWSKKLVYGENVSQTLNFAVSGSASLAFVCVAQVMRDGKVLLGTAWEVPPEAHSPVRQEGVLLNRSAGNPAAKEFASFLQGSSAKKIIKSFGFLTTGGE